jgi:type VII secretion integral membrane protein EccD
MNPATATDVCRVTVVAPRRRVDIALPTQVPFADLFPAVARFCGLDHADLVREQGGWVLQRLGHPPFGMSATVASAGLYDGELIYLRPKSVEMPPLLSDDIADEIAGVHEKPGQWTAADAPWVAVGACAAALLAGAVLLARSGPHWMLPAIVAGAVCVVLLAAAAAVSRAADNPGAATMLGCASLPYAFVAGVAGVAATVHHAAAGGAAGAHAAVTLLDTGALGALAGFALVMLAAVVAAVGVSRGLPTFFGMAVAGLFGAGAAGIVYGDPTVSAAGAGALVTIPALALTPLIPWASFRIAGLALPPVPATAADLRDDSLAAVQPDVRSRAAVADRCVTGAASGIGLVCAGALVALGLGHGALTVITAAVLACGMLLQSRLFRGRAQRLWLIVPAYAGLAWLAVAFGHLVTVAGLFAGGGLVLAVGSWLRAHRPSPFWGRAADIVDTMAIIALVPLALGVAGVLGYLHGLNG